MEDIQSWWELPSIAHFCSLFRAAFDLLDFDIEELEEAILTDGFEKSGSPLLVELLIRLLQGCLPGKSITTVNVDYHLKKLFKEKSKEHPKKENLFTDGEYHKLTLRKKVGVLHALCDYRLEAEDVLDLLKNLETESLRVEPLGYDDNGSTYWYFYGTRLYREEHSLYHPFRRRPKEKCDKKKKKKTKKGHKEEAESSLDEDEWKPVWQVQCYTEEDWRNLSEKFEGCESRLEKSLLQTLKDDFLPEIPRLFQEKEKIQQKRLMEFTPRRSSGRVQKLKEKREEEEKKLEEDRERKKLDEQQTKKSSESHLTQQELRLSDNEISVPFEEAEWSPCHDKDDKLLQEQKQRIREPVKKKKRQKDFHDKKILQDRDEDVLHERNASPGLSDDESPPKLHRNHKKDKKLHHRKYRKRSHKNHERNLLKPDVLLPDSQSVSDTSNKENSCVLDRLSDFEENIVTKPQMYSGRKTNNSLSSLAFSLTPSSVVPDPPTQMDTSPPNKKRVKSAHMLLQTEEDLKTGMYKVLEHLRDHEDAWPFLDPVDENFAPNYYAVIRRPMYITKMESRLDIGFYSSLVMFEADFKLMMDNCKLYNGPDSEYTHMAYTLEKVFSKLKSKYLVTEFSSDEEIYIDMSFQQSSSRKNRKRNSVDEKDSKDLSPKLSEKEKNKKKKKVGRKPKIKSIEEPSTVSPSDPVGRTKKPPTEVKDEKVLEDDDDMDDDYDEPMLLVREDPFPEHDTDSFVSDGEIPKSDILESLNIVPKWKKDIDKFKSTSNSLDSNDYHRKSESKDLNYNTKLTDKKTKKSTDKRMKISRDSALPSVSDSDSDHDGVLLYYNHNDDDNSSDEDKDCKKSSLKDRHNQLFGTTDDIEEEEQAVLLASSSGETKVSKKSKETKKKRKHSSSGGSRRNHHHHHHRSKSSKEGKHHKRKLKTSAREKDSPSKKVLKVEEVYDYSEEDPSSRDSKDHHSVSSNSLPPMTNDSRVSSPLLNSSAQKPRKKTKRKEKHEKRNKRAKNKTIKKGSKKRSIKRIIKKKRKQISLPKMAAIDALSAATEQTLKDITSLLDDPEVPRFSNDGQTDNTLVSSQEFESIALKIEAEYRRKLKMDPEQDKKSSKKRKRKSQSNESSPKKKKIKKNKHSDNKENDKDEKKSESDSNLDNSKELFKDIKDGRIKPGAIIKSKDIAKKEGMVKKETKAPTEGKSKNKQNPFGKINKQENTKLTSLIAKAKESRVGLVPNSEVGDSPKLSLGSIILFGDIGSGKHSVREPNSPEEDDKFSDKVTDKWENSPWENRIEKDLKDEVSNTPSSQQNTEEEEEKSEIEEVQEVSPDQPLDDVLIPPMTPRSEFKQEKVTPNLSAWFRAFGGPKLTAAPRKRMGNDDERMEEDDEEEGFSEDENMGSDKERRLEEANQIHLKQETIEDEQRDMKELSPGSPTEDLHSSPRPATVVHAEVPVSPQPPVSPEKPPETPWFDKLSNEKLEEEPIWKKNTVEEDDDPYKFEEEELDRAREEAKKLEVERQRKASVSSSGLSDPSPLNIDSDRSPAAFSSEGERSPATRSPLTPGFGGGKQYSPVTEKSPNVPAYSPRYETSLSKSFSGSFEEKSKYQSNGSLKVGFYQDMTDKGCHDKGEQSKSNDQKIKESPIYSPTVPYVSPLYPNKDQNLCKQKSPARYGSYYSSVDSSLDKPKTPGYYSTSAPSTPTERTSQIVPSEDKQKSQYGYYNYDPTKSLTDQYKNTGSTSKSYYSTNEPSSKPSTRSPLSCSNTALSAGMSSTLPMQSKGPPSLSEKLDVHPPKKRQAMERAMIHQQNTLAETQNVNSNWGEKSEQRERPHRSSYPAPHPLPADLANLSQIVSRIPEPQAASVLSEKERLESFHPSQQLISSKTVQPPGQFDSSSTNQATSVSQANHVQSSSRSMSEDSNIDADIVGGSEFSGQNVNSPSVRLHGSKSSHLQPPPAAHQKIIESERPGSRNMPPPAHSGEKPLGYLHHQKNMWSSSLPTSSLSSLVSNAAMASIALAGQKGLSSFGPPDPLAQFGMDRATLASLRQSQGSSQLFPHEILQRNSSSQNQGNASTPNTPSGLSLQSPHLSSVTNVGATANSHSRGSSNSASAASGSSPSVGSSNSSNFDLSLSRSYASMMGSTQSSPLFARTENPLTPGSLPRSLSGSSSPFLSQSPGLGGALPSCTPTPAHQSQTNFPSISRDPRDPISPSHPSLQIPSLNSIACSQAQQTLSHLNSLAYSTSRDPLSLMNQGSRGPLVDPSPQQLYQQYLQRTQLAAQEELLLRSAGAHSQLAHQSMMIQQGLMSAAAASYPSGYPHSLGLRSGSYQGMNRPWI